MNYKIKVYRHFEKEVKKLSKRYKSLKQDLTILAAELMQNPDMGTDLGNGLHKVRMSIASKGKGKRGGARVITLIATLSKEEKEIGLHFIYDKSERENITDKELQAVLKDKTLSKILCKWEQDSAVSLFLYLDSVFKNKHKLIHNQAPVMNRLCPFLLNLHK